MRRRWQILGLAAAVSLAVTACGSSKSSSSTTTSAAASGGSSSGTTKPLADLSIAYASAGDSTGIFKTVGDSVVGDGTKLGMKVKRYDNNLDGPTALNNAGLMVQSKPDVAIDWNTVVGVGNAVGAKFTSAKIPCLAVNQQIQGCAWFNLSNKQAGLDSAAVILPVAQQRGWTGSNTTVVMVIAAANGTEVNDGPRYFYTQTAATLPGFAKVTPDQITASTTTIGGTNGIQIDCKSTLDGAYAAMQNVIGSIPKGNNVLLFGSDDDCTLGAYRSLKAGGFGDRVLTGGLGADPDGLTLLRTDPNWLSEAGLFIDQWGAYVLSEAVAIAQGVTPPALTSAPQVTMTKATESTYYDSNNNNILLPPLVDNNKYLAKYGILQKFAKVQGLT
jgi:ribose transport system substrate-binding protein